MTFLYTYLYLSYGILYKFSYSENYSPSCTANMIGSDIIAQYLFPIS